MYYGNFSLNSKPTLNHGPVWSQIRVRSHTISFQQGYSVMATNIDGEIDGEADHGLYEHNTRYISRYIWQINDRQLTPVAVQPADYNVMLGYYLAKESEGDLPSREAIPPKNLDVMIARFIGQGMHEDLLLTNYSAQKLEFELSLALEVDFADMNEVQDKRREQVGLMSMDWDPDEQSMRFNYAIQDIRHGLILKIKKSKFSPYYRYGKIRWYIELSPAKSIDLCLTVAPLFCGKQLMPHLECHGFNVNTNFISQGHPQGACAYT